LIKVKCFTFIYKANLQKLSVSNYTITGKFLELIVDGYVVTPYIKLTPTNSYFPESLTTNFINGEIAPRFNLIDCNITESKQELIIEAKFTVEVELDDPVELRGNEIIWPQEGNKYPSDMENHSFKVEGSFTDINYCSLIESIDLNLAITLDAKVSIEDMTM